LLFNYMYSEYEEEFREQHSIKMIRKALSGNPTSGLPITRQC